MSRGPQTFRQRDVTKAVKAVVAAGMTVAVVKVQPDGTIVVSVGESDKNAASADGEVNEWDRV
jgi:hypothetical protein